MARKPLNPRQVEVLKWISDCCPEGVMTDETHKLSAVALKSRRLVKISKRDGWHAEITNDGRYYLERDAYPDEEPKPARLRRVQREAPPRPSAPVDRPSTEADAPADEAPTEIRPPLPPEKPAIAVPATLRKPHPVVAELRDSRRDLGVTPSARGRVLRVLQAIAKAAEQCGYKVEAVKRQSDSYGRTWYGSDHLVINTGEVTEGVRIVQLSDKTPHVLTAKEAREVGDRWAPTPPKYDHTPNAYLRVELDRSWGGSRYSWSEGPRGPIDRKLPAVLEEITHRHEGAKERRLQAEAELIERERQWHVIHDRAKVLLQESHRADVLGEQADDWRRARELREYVEAMRLKATAIASDDERTAALEWIEWSSRFAESLDPLNREIEMPPGVEPKPEALQPFMGGWNAYGPRGW